jgi:hypothetical protein
MFTALFSFLGGSVFRMLWGELSHWLSERQAHAHEIERLRLQAEIDAAQHDRNQQAIKLQAELGVQTIRVQAEADIDRTAAEGWLEAVKATGRSIGVAWIDAWNAMIRPGVATWAIVMMTLAEFAVISMSENAVAVCSAALGIYLAERNLIKRGK